MLVTHDRYFLNRVVNRIVEIDKGKLYFYDGNFEYFLEKKTKREELNIAMEEKRRRLYINELAWIRRGAKARTTKQKARIQRFEEIKDAIMFFVSDAPTMLGTPSDIPQAVHDFAAKMYNKL